MTEHHDTADQVTERDPHVAWWLAFSEISHRVNNYELLTGREPTDDNEDYTRQMDRLSELTDKILETQPLTFQGARIQWRLVLQEFGPDTDTAGDKALANLRCFVARVEAALKSRGRLAEIEAAMRDFKVPAPTPWTDGDPAPAAA